jgi:hypothetical protein
MFTSFRWGFVRSNLAEACWRCCLTNFALRSNFAAERSVKPFNVCFGSEADGAWRYRNETAPQNVGPCPRVYWSRRHLVSDINCLSQTLMSCPRLYLHEIGYAYSNPITQP